MDAISDGGNTAEEGNFARVLESEHELRVTELGRGDALACQTRVISWDQRGRS